MQQAWNSRWKRSWRLVTAVCQLYLLYLITSLSAWILLDHNRYEYLIPYENIKLNVTSNLNPTLLSSLFLILFVYLLISLTHASSNVMWYCWTLIKAGNSIPLPPHLYFCSQCVPTPHLTYWHLSGIGLWIILLTSQRPAWSPVILCNEWNIAKCLSLSKTKEWCITFLNPKRITWQQHKKMAPVWFKDVKKYAAKVSVINGFNQFLFISSLQNLAYL